jgi:hypothetical protein
MCQLSQETVFLCLENQMTLEVHIKIMQTSTTGVLQMSKKSIFLGLTVIGFLFSLTSYSGNCCDSGALSGAAPRCRLKTAYVGGTERYRVYIGSDFHIEFHTYEYAILRIKELKAIGLCQ